MSWELIYLDSQRRCIVREVCVAKWRKSYSAAVGGSRHFALQASLLLQAAAYLVNYLVEVLLDSMGRAKCELFHRVNICTDPI